MRRDAQWRPWMAAGVGIWIFSVSAGSAQGGVEVFEVGPGDTDRLPHGKEADGIVGDFVLRNDSIEALVGGDLPDRKANMGVNWDQPTPGCLYDLSVRGSNNDQLTYLGPGGLEGPVSFVRRIGAGETPLGAEGVRVERTVPSGAGHGQRHDYALRDDWRFLAILSTYTNGSNKGWTVDPQPTWKEFANREAFFGVLTGDATNPTDRQGYAAAVTEWKGAVALGPIAQKVVLKPGEERSFLTLVAPGRSPAQSLGIVLAVGHDTGTVRGKILSGGKPALTARLELLIDDAPVGEKGKTPPRVLLAYARPDGEYETALPPGRYAVRSADLGRPGVEHEAVIASGQTTVLDFDLPPAARVDFQALSEGAPVPCKVQFIGLAGTKDPYFGVDIQAHGCRNTYMAESGRFTQQVDPGRYRLVATHGIEFDHVARDIEVTPGAVTEVRVELHRLLETPGWVSTDFHNHSTPSGDNYCGTDDRVINLAVENVEFAPTTEHNRLYDWTPHIRSLGLEKELRTIVGLELTGKNAHFNAFPFEVKPFTQDGGAPKWQFDPRLNAIVLRDFQGGGPYRWVQLNHPQVGKFFRDRDEDGVADGGYEGLEYLIDGAEVWSLDILSATPRISRVVSGRSVEYENRTFSWLQLLNQGMRMNCISVSDAHAVFGNAAGGWRTYVKSSRDRPAELDPEEIIRNSKAGRMFVTTGPYLEVRLDDGTEIGDSTVASGEFKIHVKVSCTDWIDIDRVQVLVNGRVVPELSFTRAFHPALFSDGVVKFEHSISIQLREDAHLIVAAVGERYNLRTGYGKSSPGLWSPCAFTNPIYVDVDGHGWRPNGDTLGYPLPLGK